MTNKNVNLEAGEAGLCPGAPRMMRDARGRGQASKVGTEEGRENSHFFRICPIFLDRFMGGRSDGHPALRVLEDVDGGEEGQFILEKAN